MKLLCIGLAAMLFLAHAAGGSVSVVYAASLVRVMEGSLAVSLARQTGLRFEGEAKGSSALAHLIAAGLRTPDAFISADPQLLRDLMGSAHGSMISGYTVFGSARMVLAYSNKSPHRVLFEQAARGKRSLLDVLANPAVRLGRTDPQLDPKGARTVRAVQLLGTLFHRPAQAASILQRSPTFPEEDLAVRVESGELDAGFFYSTEIAGRGLRVVQLPAGANLSQEITYSIATLRQAPHPRAARIFRDFIVGDGGKRVLERAGVRYFARARVVGAP